MNKKDIKLIKEAYGQVNEMGKIREDDEYTDSALEVQAENALSAFLTQVDPTSDKHTSGNPFKGQFSVPMRRLSQKEQVKVIDTWIRKLREYRSMKATGNSPARSWD